MKRNEQIDVYCLDLLVRSVSLSAEVIAKMDLDILRRLEREIITSRALIYRNINQHRRVFAFRSFSHIVHVADKLHKQSMLIDSDHPEARKQRKVLRAAIQLRLPDLLAHANRLTVKQTGAGFVNLYVCMCAITAEMISLLRQLTQANVHQPPSTKSVVTAAAETPHSSLATAPALLASGAKSKAAGFITTTKTYVDNDDVGEVV
jgi:hypothetical protein